jgi:hypothetical protein
MRKRKSLQKDAETFAGKYSNPLGSHGLCVCRVHDAFSKNDCLSRGEMGNVWTKSLAMSETWRCGFTEVSNRILVCKHLSEEKQASLSLDVKNKLLL